MIFRHRFFRIQLDRLFLLICRVKLVDIATCNELVEINQLDVLGYGFGSEALQSSTAC